mmetsp:Transcript_26765/g.39721  ORF Transcript_26765/g.39721 Transcript_26765/m.39721 type:complete len:322 (+) Transcript_26765:129-1094(+)|eukprot:CAMPEP_0185025444 /NCGR_PEP_ID=MMETSP1103-20130426/8397_1 /TAXON_ID=36769 /ORGANISM="Paraphysomonas bandaiensis, Strain Caron Lab Isolate" /LENGTH=321 /DNA_ID=CAMNT_0027558643 /DNA_START=60 /DNA_END=1025 /DNA_ORIENTATION=+
MGDCDSFRNCELSNGVVMPTVGFGAAFGNWVDKSQFMGFRPELGYAAIPAALRAGYRHFDCALIYGSHRVVGSAIGQKMAADSTDRSEFFITTKVFHPPTDMALNHINRTLDMTDSTIDIKTRVWTDFERCLDELSFGYVDLLLMHWPGAFNTTDEAAGRQRRKECWEAFEEIYASGKARAIGVSNFQVKHLRTLLEDAKVAPMVNQIEINPYITQPETVDFCRKHNIQLVAWAPFGSGGTGVLEEPLIASIAAKYNKNAGQIILRWLIQQNIAVLPKSSNESRMRSNLGIYDFCLEDDEIKRINALDRNLSSVSTSENIA